MSDLLSRVPRIATRHRDGALDEVPGLRLAADLGVGIDGLTSDGAAAQLAAVEPNPVEDGPRLSALSASAAPVRKPLVLIVDFAASVSLLLQQWVDAGIILAIVLGSSLGATFPARPNRTGERGGVTGWVTETRSSPFDGQSLKRPFD